MFEDLASVLAADLRIGYALVFGSSARGTAHTASDLDVAIGVREPLGTLEIGDLIARLEAKAGRDVDLLVLDEAPPSIAFRVFRDGVVVLDRDHEALVARKARAMLEYYDFKPIEDLCVRGVMAAAKRGR